MAINASTWHELFIHNGILQTNFTIYNVRPTINQRLRTSVLVLVSVEVPIEPI